MKLGLGLYRHMLTRDNFSIAGVWGHVVGPFARGGAESVGFLGPDGPEETLGKTGTMVSSSRTTPLR